MEIELRRKWKTENSTIGELFINGVHECYTLEDRERPEKSKKGFGKTAIPIGRYEIVINYSNAFKTYLPLLLNVKGFLGIRIHPGNTEHDTLGCILVGSRKAENQIMNSRLAFNDLFKKLKEATKKEKIDITVK